MGHGRLFALYVAGYCVGRFSIELLRDDVATHIAGIRINSFTSTFVFIGAAVYLILAPKGREDPELLRPEKELAAAEPASGTDEVAESDEMGATESAAADEDTAMVETAAGEGDETAEPAPCDANAEST
jgi:hypothetical protein